MARHLRLKHPNVYQKAHPFLDKRIMKRPPRSTSWIRGSWGRKYCERVSGNKYKCNICDTVLSLSNGLFSNMKRHIKHKHPLVYEQEVDPERSHEEFGQAEVGSESGEYVTELVEELNKTDYEKSGNAESDSDATVRDTSFLDEDDPDFEAKVKYLVTKRVECRKRARNCMWNFFDVVKHNSLYKCLACNRRVSIFAHSIANLKRHIRNRHKYQYSLMMKYMDECEENRSTSPVSFEKYYFEQEGDGKYKCKECDSTISSTGEDQVPLFEHIKEAHPNLILAFQEEDVANDDQEKEADNNEQEEDEDKDNIDKVNIVVVKEIDGDSNDSFKTM